MNKPANRWLLVCAAGAAAISLGACHKTQTATDLSNSADASAMPPPAADNAAADNAMATNDASATNGAPAQ